MQLTPVFNTDYLNVKVLMEMETIMTGRELVICKVMYVEDVITLTLYYITMCIGYIY